MARHCANPDCPGLARDGMAPEFRDHISECADCGSALMAGPATEDPPEPTRRGAGFRTVFIAADPVQAHLVGDLIASEKIRVYLKGERLVGAIGELPADVGQIEVQVPDEDFEAGRSVVRAFEGPSADGLSAEAALAGLDAVAGFEEDPEQDP